MQSLQKHSARHIERVQCGCNIIGPCPSPGCGLCTLWTLLFVPMVLSHLPGANSRNLISVKEFIVRHPQCKQR